MKSLFECISLITELQGTPISTESLISNAVYQSNSKIDYRSLGEYIRSEGYDNTLLSRRLDSIPSLAVPVILILKNHESVVVMGIDGVGKNKIYQVMHPEGISQELSHNELQDLYSGYCWFIKPRKKKDLRSDIPEYDMSGKWLFKIIWRFKHYYYQIILASFIINFLALVSSLYVMNVYDRVIPNKSYETLWVLSIGVVIAIIFECIAKLMRGYLTDIAGKKADLIISSALFRKVMSIKLSEKPSSSGSYANNLREYESVRDFMTSATLLAFVDLPFIFLFIGIITLIAGKLALVPLILIPIAAGIGLILQRPLTNFMRESMKDSSQRQGLIVEALDGIETLKLNNAINWAQERWDRFTAGVSASAIKLKNTSNVIMYVTAAIQQLNTVLLVFVGTYLIHSENPYDKITMGALIASVVLSGRALAPLGMLASLATRYQQAKLALKGLEEIAQKKSESDNERNYVTLKNIQGEIVIKNVSFSYNKEQLGIMSDVSVFIRPGEKVGIVGKIGGGKSTLLKLMVGLYQPSQGNITLDSIDIRQLDPFFIRNKIYLLEQYPHLFLGTLRENLMLSHFDNYLSDVEMINAAARFGFDSVIKNHPRGLDMLVGEGGSGLSGGQRQIIALIRMILRSPKVVLLDEPTTGLDQASEIIALNAINNWARDKTMIVVTHRPQVLNIVDRLIVIDEGKVLLDGPRDEVLKKISF